MLEDALRSGCCAASPELRARLAIELYRREEVSLSRAAEISGLDLENFKELLREAGVVRRVLPRGKPYSMKQTSSCWPGTSPCMHTLAHRHGMSLQLIIQDLTPFFSLFSRPDPILFFSSIQA